jgi:hypothetical protein
VGRNNTARDQPQAGAASMEKTIKSLLFDGR